MADRFEFMMRDELERRGLSSADTLRFSLFADEDLVSTIAGFLPSTKATPHRTFTVKHRSAPAIRTDTERLAEVMSGERLGSGFLTATGRLRTGEHRSAPPVGWLDTGQGRYLVETTPAAKGTTVATYRPASAAELATTVRHVISSVH